MPDLPPHAGQLRSRSPSPCPPADPEVNGGTCYWGPTSCAGADVCTASPDAGASRICPCVPTWARPAIITTVAGMTGYFSSYGDGGPATSARLFYPEGIAVDALNNVYISDTFHCTVRVVSAASGNITAIAGTQDACGSFSVHYGGDGGPATSASLWNPTALALDSAGRLYIADTVRAPSRVVARSCAPRNA